MDRQGFCRLLLIGLGLPVFLLAGCASTDSARINDAPDLLQSARKAYLKGVEDRDRTDTEQLRIARKRARSFLERSPNDQQAAEALYLIAQVEYQFENQKNVLRAVDQGLQRVERADLKAALLLLSGRAHGERGETEDALSAYQSAHELMEKYTGSSNRINRAELQYRWANMLVRSGAFDRAKNLYQTILAEFTDSAYADRARGKLRFMKDHYSVQLGLFRQKDNALSLRRKLKRNGHDAYVLTKETRNGTLYSVRLGKFNQRGKAEQLAERLKQQGYDVIVKP